jgi:hypothetical protein
VDADFSDPRGKMFDRTRFDSTSAVRITCGRRLLVTVHRPDGATIGTTQTLCFARDNPVDCCTISFVGTKKTSPRRPQAPMAERARAANHDQLQRRSATHPASAETPGRNPDPAAAEKVPLPRTVAGATWLIPVARAVQQVSSRSVCWARLLGGCDAKSFR